MSGRHDHSHASLEPPGGDPAERRRRKRALTLVLVILVVFLLVEVAGGLIAGSIALLADAGHMLSDIVAVALALAAATLAARPASARHSYGLGRTEILAALINGAALIGISVWVLIEAIGRLTDPPGVDGDVVLVVGTAGLLANVAAAVILLRVGGDSLNVRAALLHVLGDLLGSLGVVGAALVIIYTGFERADPLIAIAISVLIMLSAIPILRQATSVLLESAPSGVDTEDVGRAMAQVDGVSQVHDLHIWTITSGFPALTAHVLVPEDEDCHAVRRRLEHVLHDELEIPHTTLQVDHLHEAARDGFVPIDSIRRRSGPSE